MGNVAERVKGGAQELKGKIKGAVGDLTDNEKMEREGKAEELAGKARRETAKASERVRGAVEKATGAVKGAVGKVVGNDRLRAEGKVDELKGETRREFNR